MFHPADPPEHIDAQQGGTGSHQQTQQSVNGGVVVPIIGKGQNRRLGQNQRDEGCRQIDGFDSVEQRVLFFRLMMTPRIFSPISVKVNVAMARAMYS